MKTILYSFILLFTNFAHSLHSCNESKSPLFKSKKTLDLEVIIDIKKMHKDVNTSAELYESVRNKQYPSIITYKDKNDVTVIVPTYATVKGGARQSCEYVPIEFALGEEVTQSDQTTPMKEYKTVQKLLLSQSKPLKGIKHKETIFQKLGKNIRLVTHCGNTEFDWLGGSTKEEQEQRLLLEYYIYQVLDTFQSTTLKTRLVRITYKDPNNQIMDTAYAFLREKKKNVAKRCGLLRSHSNQKEPENDNLSRTLLDIFQVIALNTDYSTDSVEINDEGVEMPTNHNVYKLYTQNFDRRLFVPYDFDLTELWTNEEGNSLSPHLFFTEEQRKLGKKVFLKKMAIITTVKNSLLRESLKDRFINHINKTFDDLKRLTEAEY